MDVIREKTAPSQHTARQYFTTAGHKFGVLNPKWIKLSLFFLLLGVVSSVSFFLAREQKFVPYQEAPIINEHSGLVKGEEKNDAEVDLIATLQRLPAAASAASGSSAHRELLEKVHSYNQSYKLIQEPKLALPAIDETEYPSLAKLEGQVFPKPLMVGEDYSEKPSMPKKKTPLQLEAKLDERAFVQAASDDNSKEITLKVEADNAHNIAINGSDAEALSIQFNLDSQLASRLKAAKKLYAQGKKNAAIQRLSDLMGRHKNNWSIQKALLKILLKEQRWQDGEALIRKLQKPKLQRLAAAQLLQAQGRSQEALDLLSSELPNLEEMPDYYQSMATLSQRLEQFSKAESIYKKLLLIDNQNGAYWLGLASAQDALESPKAVSSYWRARQFNSKHKNVLNYINQRIRSLSKKPNSAALAVREEGLPI